MIKYFCDICGDEITKGNSYDDERLKATNHARHGGTTGAVLNIEIITGKNGTSNAGNFCKYCVIDTVLKLDDRPRSA